MCQQCGCSGFMEQGPRVRLERAVAVIKELGVTTENAQRFEDGERICNLLIASKVLAGEDEDVRQTAEWVMSLHMDMYAERSRTYAKAAREIFANLPAEGHPREVITTWHQLEQLCRDLGEDLVSAVEDSTMRDVIRTVQHIHDNPRERLAELARRYHLEGV